MSEFYKIPCILATTAALHIAFTPPTPPPSENERPTVVTPGNRYLDFVLATMKYTKALFWVVGFAEIAVIMAKASPSSSFSAPILSTLSASGARINLELTPLSLAGMTLVVGGGLLRLQCYRTLKKFFTFEVAIRNNHELVKTGPYGVVRHPGYAGALSHYIGMLMWFGSQGSWFRECGVMTTGGGQTFAAAFALFHTLLTLSLMFRMSEEDYLLRKSFGKKWDEWAKDVPYCIIPGIY